MSKEPEVPQVPQIELTNSRENVRKAIEQIMSEQNLAAGILAGGIAALIGAVLWAVITIAIEVQIGWMAVGVGFLVGIAVRIFGKGVSIIFGITGALWSLIGCTIGNFLTICGILSIKQNIPFFEILSRMNFDIMIKLMEATFSPMDVLFYGIAIYAN